MVIGAIARDPPMLLIRQRLRVVVIVVDGGRQAA
jgi:hypothetical protein